MAIYAVNALSTRWRCQVALLGKIVSLANYLLLPMLLVSKYFFFVYSLCISAEYELYS